MTNPETALQQEVSVKALTTDKTHHEEINVEVPNGTENGHLENETPKVSPVKTVDNVSEITSETGSNEKNQVSSSSEKKGEEVIPKVLLHQYPPAKHIPSLSPFCLKLETFMRLNKIPYENHYSFKVGKKGKMPWIEYKGERKADSNFIIEFLTEKFQLDTDTGLTDEEKALGRMVRVALEENTVYALKYYRYIDNFIEYKKLITPPNSGLGHNVGLKMTQRKMKNILEVQGTANHLKDEVYHIAEEDIKALSILLGEKEFLLGSKMTSYDCSLFGLFANILWSGFETPLSVFIKEKTQNLVHYCERIKELLWSDWSEMILSEKSEPTLKKGFSFRKKKVAKPVKVKESEPEQTAEKSGESSEVKDESPETKKESLEAKEESPETKEESPETKEELPEIKNATIEDNETNVVINIQSEIKDTVVEDKTSDHENKHLHQDSDKIIEQSIQNGETDVALIKSEE
ncbi:failed axon connections homolog [Hydra vulgaris]|uniref:Failed axon connections homolog n=1 Tax=Hydra vulgaris TaxID=6087 RepID=A0ABM4BJB9_HYDVU